MRFAEVVLYQLVKFGHIMRSVDNQSYLELSKTDPLGSTASKSNISDHLVAELSRKTVWLKNLLVGETGVLCSVTIQRQKDTNFMTHS